MITTQKKYISGFSIIDLLVSVSIVAMILSVSLFSYRSFTSKLAVSGASQEIALAMRQAQSFSLNLKEVSKGSGEFSTNYGISLSTLDPQVYYIFADKNANGKYDGDSSCVAGSECISKGAIRNNVSVVEICGIDTQNAVFCPPLAAKTVDIVFPKYNFQSLNTDVAVNFTDENGNSVGSGYKGAQIVAKLDDVQSTISVDQGSQIHVQFVNSVPTTNHPPALSFPGRGNSPYVQVTLNTDYVDYAVAASDEEDGDITASIVKTGTVNTLVLGTYYITYTVTDSGGLSATPIVRTVDVVAPPCDISSVSKTNTSATNDGPVFASVTANHLYVVNQSSGGSQPRILQVFDTTDPQTPISVGSVALNMIPQAIFSNGNYVYVVGITSYNGGTGVMKIFNVSTPSSPIQADSLTIMDGPRSVSGYGSYVYVSGGASGNGMLQVINVGSGGGPASISGTLALSGTGNAVSAYGTSVYVVQSNGLLKVINVSNPASPSVLGSVVIDSDGQALSVLGSYVYVVSYEQYTNNGTVQVFDASVPSNPVRTGTGYTSGTGPISIVVNSNKKAFIVDNVSQQFEIFDVSTPSNPYSLGTQSSPYATTIVAPWMYAYITNSVTNSSTVETWSLACHGVAFPPGVVHSR